MKKYLIAVTLLCMSSVAFAQTEAETASFMNDVYNWSTNDYYGSARTMAMGNAVTAVGGDIATIAFNPAGSAVAPYMQIAITPGVNVSMTDSKGIKSCDGNSYLAYNAKASAGRFVLPNGGFTINFNTGNHSGLKRVTFSFVSQTSNNFNETLRGRGKSSMSSYAACLSDFANKNVSFDEKRNPIFSNDVARIAYTSDIVGIDSNLPYRLVGTTENVYMKGGDLDRIQLGGPIEQNYTKRITGNKNDYIINLGFDISDIVYLGASLGINTMTYKIHSTISENNDPDNTDPDLFQTGFKSLSHTYSYSNSGTGIYGKFGIIVTPVAGLRIGAALQTPTATTIKESWSNSMNHKYLNQSASATTDGDWAFRLKQPLRFNAGLAYAFADKAMISADYEIVNYGHARMEAFYKGDEGYCDSISDAIAGVSGTGDCLGISHMVRVGLEFKPWSIIPIRAGYNFTSGGTYRFVDGVKVNGNGMGGISTGSHNISVGAGYDSPRSFFFDVAFRYTWRPSYNLNVYGTYPNEDPGTAGDIPVIGGPILNVRSNIMAVVATLGWRF